MNFVDEPYISRSNLTCMYDFTFTYKRIEIKYKCAIITIISLYFPYIFCYKHYLPRRNMRIEERRYAVIMYIQTSTDKGAMKENKFGGGGFFFL